VVISPQRGSYPELVFRSFSSGTDATRHHLRCTVYTGIGYSENKMKEGHGSVKKGIRATFVIYVIQYFEPFLLHLTQPLLKFN
jgi:hypothetical protein